MWWLCKKEIRILETVKKEQAIDPTGDAFGFEGRNVVHRLRHDFIDLTDGDTCDVHRGIR